MLDDEKGQTQTRHVLSSREGPHPPELIIEGTRADRTAPGKIRALNGGTGIVASTPADAQKLGRTTLRPGNAIVRFGGAGDDAGKGVAAHYELRYRRSRSPAARGGARRGLIRRVAEPTDAWCLTEGRMAAPTHLRSVLQTYPGSATLSRIKFRFWENRLRQAVAGLLPRYPIFAHATG